MMEWDVLLPRKKSGPVMYFRVLSIASGSCGADGANVQGRVAAATDYVSDNLQRKHRMVEWHALAALQRFTSVGFRSAQWTARGVSGMILGHAPRRVAEEYNIDIEAWLQRIGWVANHASAHTPRSIHATWSLVRWIVNMKSGSHGLSARNHAVVALV